MGKNSNTIRYETVVQLLLLATVILMPYLAFNFTDYLELFSVSKTMGICISFWSSIKPWLSPSYVYLFINFIIFFIAASSSIFSNTMGLDPSSPTDSFIESSIPCHNLATGSLPDDHDHDHSKFHTLDDTFKDRHGGEGILKEVAPESMVDDRRDEDADEEVSPETVVDTRELRKSKTFNGGELRLSGRRERYVRILSQEELDRRVEAFIYTFKKKKKESNEDLKLRSIYEPNLV
ncbi:hypothetical protein L6452_15185 [Arctium lappa]|uniref:Uncharacterized protein n=1 Tax=Arctium lappa TaxID=4217 RepID=A0ACB9CN23_ARCLA|nr:hypothetical protein L6452_15185 [Arctium lappa]